MTQKVATEHKVKSRQETTSLGQNATVTAKPRISDEEQDRDEFEIQEGEDDDSFCYGRLESHAHVIRKNREKTTRS